MTMISRAALGIAAGIFGTLFVGYCVYFDKQRRKDLNFKKKLRERRRANKISTSKEQSTFPDINDHDAVQSYFFSEVQLGEELLGQGDIVGGIEHLSNAVAVCGKPNQLLNVLQQTLPPNVFELLLKRLPEVSKKFNEGILKMPAGGNIIEDDVE